MSWEEEREREGRDMARMKLDGYSYQEIANKYQVTRQNIQQRLRPKKAIYDKVKSTAGGKCEKCGILIKSGHIHHKNEVLINNKNINSTKNLMYLCPSCHRKLHKEPRKTKNKKTEEIIKMPLILIKKLYKSGNSWHITLPLHWIKAKEVETGVFPKEVRMEVNSDITITTITKRGK